MRVMVMGVTMTRSQEQSFRSVLDNLGDELKEYKNGRCKS